MQENHGNCNSNMVIFKNYLKLIFIGKFGKLERLIEHISIAPSQVDRINYYLHNNITDQ
jgi:hypothetical protein